MFSHLGGLVLQGNDTTLNHLVVEIVALAGTLADTGEHRVASVSLGDVVDQLHDKHSLADAGTSEEADLASLGVGGQQVDNLDACDQDLLLDAHLLELGSLGVNGGALVSVHGAPLVDRVADDVDDAAEGLLADGDTDGGSGVDDLVASHKTLGTVHGNRAHGVLSQVLCDLENQTGRSAGDIESVEDLGQTLLELDVDDSTDDGDNLALVLLAGGLCGIVSSKFYKAKVESIYFLIFLMAAAVVHVQSKEMPTSETEHWLKTELTAGLTDCLGCGQGLGSLLDVAKPGRGPEDRGGASSDFRQHLASSETTETRWRTAVGAANSRRTNRRPWRTYVSVRCSG